MRPDLSECAGRACPQRGDVRRRAVAVEQAREPAGSELGAERGFADLGGVGRLEVAARAASRDAGHRAQAVIHPCACLGGEAPRSEEHTSELQSLMRISYAVFFLKKKKTTKNSQRVINTPINCYNN